MAQISVTGVYIKISHKVVKKKMLRDCFFARAEITTTLNQVSGETFFTNNK